jgi:hypothetical protein
LSSIFHQEYFGKEINVNGSNRVKPKNQAVNTRYNRTKPKPRKLYQPQHPKDKVRANQSSQRLRLIEIVVNISHLKCHHAGNKQ